MRITAERRADGVYVAAGVELIEPEYRHQSALAPGSVWVTPSQVARPGDKLGSETAKRLREATGHRDPYWVSYHRPPVLKACACSAVFVGDSCSRHCPACKREADLLSTRAAVRRLRAKRRPPRPLALQCLQCGAPMTAKRATKAFCSENAGWPRTVRSYNERARAHPFGLPRPYPVDRVRTLRPLWPLHHRPPHGKIRRRQADRAPVHPRRLPQGARVQHP